MPKVTPEYIEQKKQMIVDAAYKVCLRKPVDTVTISDVIAETGMSMGAIYRYYDGLDEILTDMVKKVRTDYGAYDRIMSLANEANGSFEENIYRIYDTIADIMEEHLMDIQKINFDFGVMAINNPERMKRILSGVEGKGNLERLGLDLLPKMLEGAEKQGYRMKCSLEEMMLFVSSSITGIEKLCILSSCYGTGVPGTEVKPRPLFRTLAKSVILLLGGNVDE
ncbi:MAG: TetR/AcrR family transcriptional regulator [Lachnospiraceae bacterium]|nr:TetR/AcrR family transcriptional regulator [Lachnospiraceae bacterium]